MNFKLFLPLTALAMLVASCQDDNKGLTKGQGTISPEFTIDYSVTNPRTMSRAENGKETVPNAPELSSFSFHLWKDDGKFDKTYTGLGGFVGAQFPVGAYSLEAFSGDIEEEGLGKPYFEGSTTFNVYDGEQAQPTLVAKLANTAVSVEYTEAFMKYFTADSTEIHSSNGTNYITMPELTTAGTESEWAYVKPGNVDINITVTKQNGVSGTVKAATIENALPATHYHVTIDANRGEVGNATITVSFDDATTLEPIEIDVSGDILVTPAPVLTAHGFTSGTPIEILEGDAAEATLKVNILAQGDVASVKLNTSSPTPELSSLQGDVELLTATEEQKNALTTLGVTTKGVWSGVGQVAEIDFTNILQNLKVANGVSDHIFTITVVDKLNRTCEPVVLKIQAPKPVLVISNQQELAYGQTTAEFDFTYNGKDIQNKVKFQATNAGDDWEDCTYSSVVDNGGGSYHVVINIPLRSSDSKVRAIYNKTTSAEYTFKRKIELAAADYDVWATKATVSMSPAAMRSQVTAIYLDKVQKGTAFNDYSQFTFTGLTPGTPYTAKAVLNNGTEATVTFTTEAAAPVPNGDFEDLTQTITIPSINQGGGYYLTKLKVDKRQNTTSYDVKEPTGWTSINSTTCNYEGAQTKNTWFVVPSTMNTTDCKSGLNAMIVRSVAWDLTGALPADDNSVAARPIDEYYSYYAPSSIKNRSAGELNLNTSFVTRPSKLSGWFKYTCDTHNSTEKGVVSVKLYNGETEIAQGWAELSAVAEWNVFNIDLVYSSLTQKATSLKIEIKSTNKNPVQTTDYTEWIQSSIGAVLTIDNLTFSY